MEATRDDPAFISIVVGTDGSKRAGKAVRQATHLARSTGARLEVVSAYRPVPEQRLREQRKDVPEKYRWMVNPRQDVDTILKGAVEEARGYGAHVSGHARETDPASARPRRRRGARGGSSRRRQQGNARGAPLPRERPEQGLSPRHVQRVDRRYGVGVGVRGPSALGLPAGVERWRKPREKAVVG
jgi:Universal stress protein family